MKYDEFIFFRAKVTSCISVGALAQGYLRKKKIVSFLRCGNK